MKTHALQYTIRGVPAEVDRILRERAKTQHSSINQIVVEELTKATLGAVQRENFMDLVGTWEDDPEFDAIIESQRQVDPRDWQ